VFTSTSPAGASGFPPPTTPANDWSGKVNVIDTSCAWRRSSPLSSGSPNVAPGSVEPIVGRIVRPTAGANGCHPVGHPGPAKNDTASFGRGSPLTSAPPAPPLPPGPPPLPPSPVDPPAAHATPSASAA